MSGTETSAADPLFDYVLGPSLADRSDPRRRGLKKGDRRGRSSFTVLYYTISYTIVYTIVHTIAYYSIL